MKISSEKHEFAFYSELVKELKAAGVDQVCMLTDKELSHRMLTVLRLKEGDQCILFDDRCAARVTLVKAQKSTMSFLVGEITPHKPLNPPIHWMLPLLKRDAFEEALYSLVELGATSIVPFVSTKTGRMWLGQKERARCRALMVAAAEQSKQFLIPSLGPVTSLKECIEAGQNLAANALFLDAAGTPFFQCIEKLLSRDSTPLLVCSGPEGDLTVEEKTILKQSGFSACALTPTVLRAQQAVAVGLGALRSVLRPL